MEGGERIELNPITVLLMRITSCLLVTAALVIASMLLVGCTGSNDEFLEKMRQQMKPVRTMTHGYRVLNLSDLTDFEWDSVYFFRGGSVPDNAEINSKIGFEWDGESVPDGFNRLLFVRGREVVSYTDFIPWNEQPMPIWMFGCRGDRGWGISRKDARFAVFRDCASGETYDMVPLRCIDDFRVLIEQGCTEKTLKILDGPHLYDSTGGVFPVAEDSTGKLVPIKELNSNN